MTLSSNDRIELQSLLMRYTHILDYGDIDELDEVWHEQCEFVVDEPSFHIIGLERLKETLRGTRRDNPHARHVVTNCHVDGQGDQGRVQAYLQILDTRNMKPTLFARYVDHCIRTNQGWRIRSRQCING